MKYFAKSCFSGLALASLLTACGGGGSSSDAVIVPPVTITSPLAGAWSGTSTSGNTVEAIVLEDGKLWAITGLMQSNVLYVNGLNRASLQTSGNSVTSSDLRAYNFATGTSLTGTLAGTFVAGTSLSATATASTGAASALTLAPAPAANYNYNTPATLAAIAGSWPGFFTNATGTLLVNANGTYSSTTSTGCNVSGAITPRASGKNVYDVSVNLGASPCPIPNGSGTGNALITLLADGSHQLTVAFSTADASNAGVFFGRR